MKPTVPFPGINRRALVSTMALLPALSVPFFPASAPAQTATSGNSLPSWNDGAVKQAIVDFVQLQRGGTQLLENPGIGARIRTQLHTLDSTLLIGSLVMNKAPA